MKKIKIRRFIVAIIMESYCFLGAMEAPLPDGVLSQQLLEASVLEALMALPTGKRVPTQEEIVRWFDAIEKDNHEIVRELIATTTLGTVAKGYPDINVFNEEGWTGLLVAIWAKNTEMAQLLLRSGADHSLCAQKAGANYRLPPLLFALIVERDRNIKGKYFVRSTIIKDLIAHGAKYNEPFQYSQQSKMAWGYDFDWYGKTPLMVFAAHVAHADGWDEFNTLELLSKDADFFDLRTAFVFACHCPRARTIAQAAQGYAQKRKCAETCRRPNALVVDYLANAIKKNVPELDCNIPVPVDFAVAAGHYAKEAMGKSRV